jgi:Tfp pilus assembly ATPase PilU
MTDIHSLLKLMVDKSASDVFLTCGTPPHLSARRGGDSGAPDKI